jgi:hypothetical protein
MFILAEIPGVARDSIGNEGTREINYGIIKHNYNFQRFLPPKKEPPLTHWLGDWLGPRTGLDVVDKRNILPLPVIQPRLTSPSRRHEHRSDKNVVYCTSHLFFTSFMGACT